MTEDRTSQPESYPHKLGVMVVSKLTGELWQFARGAVQLSMSVTYGPVGTLLAATTFAGLSMLRQGIGFRQGKQGILDLYRDQIAAITHTPANQLTLQDVDRAAQFSPNGQKNAIALELEAAAKNSGLALQKSMISVVAVAVLGIGVASILPASLLTGAGFSIAAAGFGALSSLVFMSADHFVSNVKGRNVDYSFNAQLKDMVAQSKFRALPAEQIFDLLLKASPGAAQQIEQEYGQAYSKLPLGVKTKIVAHYEELFHANQLAEMINSAQLCPQELGFIAYGQLSGNDSAVQPAQHTEFSHITSTDNVARLQEGRIKMASPTSPTLH